MGTASVPERVDEPHCLAYAGDCRAASFAHVNADLGGIAPPARTNQHRFPSAMPMLRGDVAIGTLSVLRPLSGPLSDKQHALLRTFAVIAIENTRLLKELHERRDDLSESLQQ